MKRIAIGSDHVGYPLKEEIKNIWTSWVMFTRILAHSPERTDYPLFAKDVTSAIASEQAELGILICGTAWGCPSPPTKSKGHPRRGLQ